jgi:Flp pilus assembly secretin CpaC
MGLVPDEPLWAVSEGLVGFPSMALIVPPAGPIVDRNQANTRVVLLDGEQTIIGGLYSTVESTRRRGIPLLKDLPGWFFGIRYLTGMTQTTLIQQELLIVLQARVVDPLRARADRPFEDDLLRQVYEMTDKRFRVQKLPVHQLYALHGKIIPAKPARARENTPIIQQPPRRLLN